MTKSSEKTAESQRKLGSAKGKIIIADDFDAPIEDFNSISIKDKDEILNQVQDD